VVRTHATKSPDLDSDVAVFSRPAAEAGRHLPCRRPVPQYRIASRKVSPGRQFTGKNLLERIFASKLSAGETFGGNPIMGRDFLWGRQYFNKSETYQFRDYLFTGGFFMGKTFYCDTSITLRRPLNSSSCY